VTARTAEQRWQVWQTVDTGRLVLVGTTGIIVLVALASIVTYKFGPGGVDAVAFGGFIAFGELLRLSLPGNREAAPIAMTAALAYAMARRVYIPYEGSVQLHKPILLVIAVTAIGMFIGALPHLAAGRKADITWMSVRLLAVSAVAALFYPLAHHHLLVTKWWGYLPVMAVLAAVAWLIETVISAIIRADDLRARYSVTLGDELAVQWPLGLAVGVCAIITVLGAEVMGLAELAVFAGPLLVIQFAFRRYAGIRATYLQTVRALAQVTEVGGYVETGHSLRVTKLALAIGRELGMPEADLLDLEYAALMHDIGQLSLAEPIPGGATLLVPEVDAHRIAELGAEVIRQTGVLDSVAELVRAQWLPYRDGPRVPPLGSRVIRAANAFDDLVVGSSDRDRMSAAIGRLRVGTESQFDPIVVEALATVADRLPLSRL
jgi:HD domain